MPLVTKIERGGEKVKFPVPWDYTLLSFMYTAATREAEPDREYDTGKTFGSLGTSKDEATGEVYDQFVDFSMAPIYYLDWKTPLVARGEQTLEKYHRFLHHVEENGRPVVIEFKPGDVLLAYRESSR
jgi:hypothetical protein